MQSKRALMAVNHYLQTQLLEMSRHPRKAADTTPRSFITLSRQAGAGGMDVAHRVAGLLNENPRDDSPCPWTVFDRDLVRHVLKDHPLHEEAVRAIEEERSPEVAKSMMEFFGLKRATSGLVAKTSRATLQLASLGCSILVGHAACIVTHGLSHGFHVRMIASKEKRIAHITTYDGLSKNEALSKLQKEDRARHSFARKYFDRDITDPLLYSVTINVDQLDPEETARVIVESLYSWQRSWKKAAASL